MFGLVHPTTRQVMAIGLVLYAPPDGSLNLVEIHNSQMSKFDEPGNKILELDGSISVTPPSPAIPPVAQPDMNSDVPIDNATVTQIVSSLRTYLQTPNASLTALNNAQALKALIRLVFFIFKRLVVLQ